MQYKVGEYVIKSELAAKPWSQRAAAVTEYLLGHGPIEHALDYGCGKLRYSSVLAATADHLTVVDSPEQLDRTQRIQGVDTSVRAFVAASWSHVRIETIDDFRSRRAPKFDFAICTNVLSAIPNTLDRVKALEAVRARLRATGRLLVVNQHTNSYFSGLARREDAQAHLDGWMIRRERRASFYGILNVEDTGALLRSTGYKVLEQWVAGQSNFALSRVA